MPAKKRPEVDKATEENSKALLSMLAKYNVKTPEELERIFLTPALVMSNVLDYLKHASPSELAYLFYEAALVKVAARVNRDTAQSKEEGHDHSVH